MRYWEDGKAKWSRTFKVEDEAASWLIDHKRAQNPEVKAQTQTSQTFNQLADEWFALAESGAISQKGGRKYSAGTLDTYRRMYDNHVRHELGDRAAYRLAGKDWQSWLDSRVRIGLKRNSVSVALNVVRSVYRWACSPNRALLAVNATAGLELPANDETPRDRVATPEEARKLLAALESPDRTAFGLALYAGLRNCERLPMDWSDVDFKTGKLKVRVSKTDTAFGQCRSLLRCGSCCERNGCAKASHEVVP